MDENAFLRNIKFLYFSPSRFLEKNSDKKWTKILVQLLVFYTLYIVAGAFLDLILFFINNGSVLPIEILSWTFLTIQSIIGKVIIISIILFSVSGLIHLLLKITKTHSKYLINVKSVSYSLLIWVIYGFIILIASFIIQMTIPINESYLQGIISTSDVTNIIQLYKLHFSQPGAIILLIIGIIQVAHFLVFLSKSVSYFNKIKIVKSALICISSLVIVIIALFLIWIGYFYVNNYLTDPYGARFS
ncbi:hypothetical protein J4477_03330 [Candidatus Pacearchaeota archaeon]|nr:hypothetical protein [Candidatus Pacearchaeota archaeon]